ncbi:MAG: polysaccharide deacetylase family protein [Candidatus Firestonebacteria bacterium]
MAALTNIPIIMYHHVLEKNSLDAAVWGNLYVDVKDFKKQADFLKKNGYKTIDFAELGNIIDGKMQAPQKPVILTFDDAYKSTLINTAPILRENEQKAVVSLVTGCIGGLDSWDKKCKENNEIIDKAELGRYAENIFSIESHTVSHPHFKGIEKEKLEFELKESKNYIEKTFRKAVNALIYPYGEYSEEAKAAVKKAGYRFGVTVSAKTNFVLEDLYELRRVYIKNTDSITAFSRKISSWYLCYRGFRRR